MMSDLDEGGILELNQAHLTETSTLDPALLRELLAQAFHVGLRDRGRHAFLIALDQDATSRSPNFHWFRSRYERFVYIDRVIVTPGQRGQGVARKLYEELMAAAAQAGHVLVGCEVNLDPPNPASDAFHAALGFCEVGRARLPDGQKIVRYLTRALEGGQRRGT